MVHSGWFLIARGTSITFNYEIISRIVAVLSLMHVHGIEGAYIIMIFGIIICIVGVCFYHKHEKWSFVKNVYNHFTV